MIPLCLLRFRPFYFRLENVAAILVLLLFRRVTSSCNFVIYSFESREKISSESWGYGDFFKSNCKLCLPRRSLMWRDGANIRVGPHSQMILRAPEASVFKENNSTGFVFQGLHLRRHSSRTQTGECFGSHMISRTISWTPPTRNDFATSRAEHEKVYFYHDLCDY